MSSSEVCGLISFSVDVPPEIAAIIENYTYAEGEVRFLRACVVLHRRCYRRFREENLPRDLEYSCAAEHAYDYDCSAHLKILPADDSGFRLVTGIEIQANDYHSCDPVTTEIDRYISDIELAAWVFGDIEGIPSPRGNKHHVEEKRWGKLRKEVQNDFFTALEPRPPLNFAFVVKLVVLRRWQEQNVWYDINGLCAHNTFPPQKLSLNLHGY